MAGGDVPQDPARGASGTPPATTPPGAAPSGTGDARREGGPAVAAPPTASGSPPDAAPPAGAPAVAPRRRAWHLALALLALPPLLLAAVALTVWGAWRSLHTEDGTRWWLRQAEARLPGVTLGGSRGALLGADSEFALEAATLRFGRTTVRLDGLRLAGLQVDTWQWPPPHARIHARLLAARRVDVELSPEPAAAPSRRAPPSTLRLPVQARIEQLELGRLAVPGVAAPFEALVARRLEAGDALRVGSLSGRWNGLQAEGDAQIGADAPLPLTARLALRSSPGTAAGGAVLPGWAHELSLLMQAQGPLARFDARATLAMQDQRLDATAQVTPFDPLPLARLDADFARLDLARALAPLTALAPTTELSGRATLRLDREQPLAVQLHARNERPARWDRRGLPLREIDVDATGRGTSWRIGRAELELAADERTPAGRLQASGEVDGAAVRAQLRLEQLLLQGLDERAPPLRLSGPIDLRYAAPAAGAAAGTASAPAPAASAPAAPPSPAIGRLELDARLEGGLVGRAREGVPVPLRDAVRVALRGRADADEAVIETLSAQAGPSRLEGRASARREGARWGTRADLSLTGFDLSQWLPGEPGAAWRRARNALNGHVTFDARLPAAFNGVPALLAALDGRLEAQLADSALAGQPLTLALKAQAGAGRLSADGEARAGDNVAGLVLALRAPRPADRHGPAAAADDERLQLRLDAPALEGLRPLAEALGLGPLGGRARLDASAEGSLGARLFGGTAGELRTRGHARLDTLRAGTLALREAEADWNATLPPDAAGAAQSDALARAALEAHARAADVELPGTRLPELTLEAGGTLAAHRARLHALLQPRAPAGGEAPAPAPLDFEAALQGAWQAGQGGAPNAWQATLERIGLRPVQSGGSAGGGTKGTAPAAANDAASSRPRPGDAGLPLFVAQGLELQLRHAPELLEARLQPGQAEVLGVALSWSEARWERRGDTPPQLALQAEVQPVAVAPLLQRLQPEFGWAGDLRIGARARVDSGAAVTARVEIARTGGDLQVSEFGSVQSLGLSDARLALEADQGRWQLTQLIAGANLGRVEGRQALRTDPRALWPSSDAAIEGQLQVQVDNLATWGAWVPAGWRLGGQLDAALRIAGQLGAPQLIGEAHGRDLALRNALEGVALKEGGFDARFDGSGAQLLRLRFAAGEGELVASGDARLGAEPQARLELSATRATVLGRVDRRVVASGAATLRMEGDKIAVDGDFRADSGRVDISRADAPSLGDDVTVRHAGDADEQDALEAAEARRTARAVDLRLKVDLGPRFRLRGRGIDTRLTGALTLTTPNGLLAAHGEIRTDDGTYEAYGQKLDIERGVITFVGAVDNPRLDIEAIRANSDVRVGVRVSGNVLSPRIALFSDPEMPATEKLALLVTGRSYDSLAGDDALLLQRAALALLAGEGGGNGRDPAGLLRLDELSVRQSEGAVRDTIVTLGKQVSDRVYVGYERGLNATAGNWQLIYRIAQRFTLRAQSGEDSAVDFVWLFRWN